MNLTNMYQSPLQGKHFYPEDGSTRYLQNTDTVP